MSSDGMAQGDAIEGEMLQGDMIQGEMIQGDVTPVANPAWSTR
jgi:hypothetical protein